MPPEYTVEYDRRASDNRLDRIEAKLDQVAEALQTLARTEEKLVNMTQRMDTIERKMETGYAEHLKLMEAAKDAHMTSIILDRVVLRLDHLEETQDKMRVEMAKANTVQGAFERGFWVVFTGIVGSIIYFLKGGE